MRFAVTLVPVTCSPLLRRMHEQTRYIDAPSLSAANRVVKKAMKSSFDWRVEKVEESHAI